MHCTSPWAIALAQAPRRSKQSSCSRAFSAGRHALACSRTVQSCRGRALTLLSLGMGEPATVGQPAPAQPCSHACHAHAPHAHDGAQRCLLAETPREELSTFSARRCALSVAAARLRAALVTAANGLAMRHRERGARALDSSTSPMVRIAHRCERSILASPGGPWGLVMCVLDVGIACLRYTTDASGVARLAVRSKRRE